MKNKALNQLILLKKIREKNEKMKKAIKKIETFSKKIDWTRKNEVLM